MDILKVDALAWQKNSKRHFFGDIENSFHEVTHIGLEPHQFFLFQISQQIRLLEASKHCQKWPKRVHWLQQIFSYFAVNQTKIKLSSWNFQHLFIMCLCKFDEKNLAITQTTCHPRPILAKTLGASSNCICLDISKRKKTGGVLDLYE